MKRFYRLSQNSHSERLTSQRVIREGDHNVKTWKDYLLLVQKT